MKLFFAPEYSSLADHIALLEAGMEFDIAEVDLDTKQLCAGGSYLDVNPKGQVPALLFDDGELLTENLAILSWVADRAPHLAPTGEFGRYRLLEMLSFIASEIHKRFAIFGSLAEKARDPVAKDIQRWLDYSGARLGRGYLLGDQFSVADAYLFVLARGAPQFGFELGDALSDYVARISARPAVEAALRREGVDPADRKSK